MLLKRKKVEKWDEVEEKMKMPYTLDDLARQQAVDSAIQSFVNSFKDKGA